MRKLLVRLLLAILGWIGYSPLYGVPHDVLKAACQATLEAECKGGAKSGEAKRAQALRMMLNLAPDASHREMALAIELCLPH